MKKTYVALAALVMSLCLLCCAFPVTALHTWEDGTIPENWEDTVGTDDLKAVNILEPVNPNATREAKNLLAYLGELTDSQQFLTGTFDYWDDSEAYNQAYKEFGVQCAIYSNRYVLARDGSMTFTNLEQANQARIDHYHNGNVLLCHSDQFEMEAEIAKVALELGMDTDAKGENLIIHLDQTNPDRELALYEKYRLYLDNYVAGLRAMEEAGVKAYMLRFWIEFNYRTFCGTESWHYPYMTRVYQQTVQHFVDSGLKGFLIVFSPGAARECGDRYPGNGYVDILSATKYPDENTLGQLNANSFYVDDWYAQTGKPWGLSETYCRCSDYDKAGLYSRPSWYETLRSIVANWPDVSWTIGWHDGRYSVADNRENPELGNDDGKMYLDSPFSLPLEKMKDYQTGVIHPVGVAQLYYTANASDTRIALEEKAYTATDLKALGVDLAKVRALRARDNYALRIFQTDDCSGTPIVSVIDGGMKDLDAAVMKNAKSLEVVRYAVNVALEKDIYASDADDDAWKANDGAMSSWKDYVGADGTAWLALDLGENYMIGSYVLKNAGFAGMVDVYNTRGWKLQYSDDFVNWTDVDAVKDNVAGQVSRKVTPVTARYFRLLITHPNSVAYDADKGLVTVIEFELYGVAVDGGMDAKPPTQEDNADEEQPNDNQQNEQSRGEEDDAVLDDTSEPTGDDTVSDVFDEPTEDMSDDTDDLFDEPDDWTEESTDDESDDTSQQDDRPDGKKKKVISVITVGLNWWVWLLIAIGGLAVVGGAVFLIIFLRKRKRKQSQPEE